MHVIPFWCAFEVAGFVWTSLKSIFISFSLHPWYLCCTGLFKECSRYYDRRQSDDCSDYPQRPPPGIY